MIRSPILQAAAAVRGAIAAGLVVAGSTAAFGDGHPADPCDALAGQRIRWIVPHAAGGGYDAFSRMLEPFLEKALKAEVVVENVLGAGGVVGLRQIRDAEPNGRTLGVVNGAGLLVAALAEGAEVPNPAHDFSVLARYDRSRQVWAAAAGSDLATFEDVLEQGRTRPIVFATRDVGSTSFVNMSVVSSLIGLDASIVAGYSGTRAATLAVVRGEVDLMAANFESILDAVNNGDLQPVLQVSDEPVADHTSLKGVPVLGGPGGVAARRAEARGGDPGDAVEKAGALISLIGAGRLVIAPSGLSPELRSCLEKVFHDVLVSPEVDAAFAAAGRPLDVDQGPEALAEMQAAEKTASAFLPIIRRSIEEVRE